MITPWLSKIRKDDDAEWDSWEFFRGALAMTISLALALTVMVLEAMLCDGGCMQKTFTCYGDTPVPMIAQRCPSLMLRNAAINFRKYGKTVSMLIR